MSHSESPAIYAAMQGVLDDIGHIGKDRQGHGFKFRGIDQVYAAVHPLFRKQGIIVMPQVLQEQREERTNSKGTVLAFTRLLIRFEFVSTTDGSSLACTVQGEAMDSGDKSTNKAMSIALKYAIFQAFTIPTEEVDDPDAETHVVQAPVGMSAGQRKKISSLRVRMNDRERVWWDGEPNISYDKADEFIGLLEARPEPEYEGEQV